VERWRGALRELGDAASAVTWRYAAFELDPTVPPGGVDANEYLAAKYDAAMVKDISARLAAVAAAEGLPMTDLSGARRRPNTFDAHRLLTAALEIGGPAAQQALADALLGACWADGRDTGDHEVLAELAAAAGLDEARARGILAGDAYAAEVRAEERLARESGITAVPTFVVDRRLAVSGAQSPAVLAGAVRRALAPAT
jgi:predicted DsbA family dithiol-disulfide isomerase